MTVRTTQDLETGQIDERDTSFESQFGDYSGAQEPKETSIVVDVTKHAPKIVDAV